MTRVSYPPDHQMWTFFFWIHGIYTQEWLLLPLGECSGPTVPINFCSCEQDCVYTEFRGEPLTCILLFTPSVRSKCLSSSTKLFLALLLLLSDDVKTKEELEWLRPLWDFDTDFCETTWLCCAALTSGVGGVACWYGIFHVQTKSSWIYKTHIDEIYRKLCKVYTSNGLFVLGWLLGRSPFSVKKPEWNLGS